MTVVSGGSNTVPREFLQFRLGKCKCLLCRHTRLLLNDNPENRSRLFKETEKLQKRRLA